MNDNTSKGACMPSDIHVGYMQYLDRKHGDLALRTHGFRQFTMLCKALMYLALGIAAITFAENAHARDIAYLPNQAGGQIVLTDIASTNGQPIAFSREPGGHTIFGYWVAGENFVMIKWDGGSLRTFPYSDFTMYETDEPIEPVAPAIPSRWPKARP